MKNTLIKFMKSGKLSRTIEIINDEVYLTEFDEYENIIHEKNPKYELNATVINGKITTEKIKNSDGSTDINSYTYIGDKLISHWHASYTKEYIRQVTISNIYNEENKRIGFNTIFPGGEVITSSIEYKDNKEIITSSDGNVEVFTYDNNKRCISIESNTYKNYMKYDEKGNVIHNQSLYFIEEENTWDCVDEFNTYNEHDDVIRTIVQNKNDKEIIERQVFYIEEGD